MTSRARPDRRRRGRLRACAAALVLVAPALWTGAVLGRMQPGHAAALGLSPGSLVERIVTQAPAKATCVLTASADTYIDELSPTTNFGTATTLGVESAALANDRALVRFSLSSCGIPTSTDVDSATLSLTLSTAPSSSRTYEARRVTSSWSETSVTWGTRPSSASSATATTSTGTTAGVALQWSVRSDVQSVVNGTATNHGWRIADTVESAVLSVRSTFASREHATTSARPTLSITYWR